MKKNNWTILDNFNENKDRMFSKKDYEYFKLLMKSLSEK